MTKLLTVDPARSEILCITRELLAGIPMTEERKHAIFFAATLLCARRLIGSIESNKPNCAPEYFVDKTIDEAVFVLERIDERCPVGG
jgi:hypothetical protein